MEPFANARNDVSVIQVFVEQFGCVTLPRGGQDQGVQNENLPDLSDFRSAPPAGRRRVALADEGRGRYRISCSAGTIGLYPPPETRRITVRDIRNRNPGISEGGLPL